ncbi:M20/M25/M40 family metallo-hydrolase [Conexibacter sp. CPCC 206217]|uniref:M20/M25/M40 family metallo-hydrolase n=1 Tax=Conexibacter sp. CPCC 206217 TaxID=3064574 RepID=UPI00271E3AAE|nr:M20/M25/M40 family metallo-hydrolase [Conexibacter sp. CPCC 206217]MDO8212882.1 M20/M25/M40 family metallo-hydrolase [Conexibacter sp. CPCC 206217]
MPADHADPIEQRPLELLQRLLRFDTSNPPGAERACIEWLRGLLDERGIETRIVGRDPQRPNLIARIAGRGAAAPLLLHGHVDVVPAPGDWTHPPFAGEIADGFVWGRGALDMKGGVAMLTAAFLRAHAAATPPPGDLILCLLSDEEAGSTHGAEQVVADHPELFAGVRYALGEFGGFTLELAGRRFYPVMVAEKQVCWIRATFRGRAGHGSMPVRDSAAGRLGRLLAALDRGRLPVHVTPSARMMVEGLAADVPAPVAATLRGLLRPRLTDRLLDLLGERGAMLDPLLHHTASATLVRGGEQINVIPAAVTAELDCRLLPGFRPDEVLTELRALGGVDFDAEIVRHDAATARPDLGLFDTLADALRAVDPAARPVPMLLPGVTDGRFFARLGIQTYGFLPMQLPPEMRFNELVHAPDERLPVAAVEFGTTAIARVLERF